MFKRCGSLITVILIVLAWLVTAAPGQMRGSGSISGTVTLSGKRARGVPVVAALSGNARPGESPPFWTSTTDNEGTYRISGLVPGRYAVAPYQPTNVLPEKTTFDTGSKEVSLGENESISEIDFKLSPGAVVTGRIIGPDGRPLIEQRVTVESVDGKQLGGFFGGEMYETDDRGVYRIYGLPAGRYIVSVGDEKNSSTVVYGPTSKGFFTRTFYPGTTEKADAKILELGEGSTETGIDIAVGPREKAFSISGRMVDQATGRPVADIPVAYGVLRPGENGVNGFGWSVTSDATGRFKLNSLKPGRYSVFPAQPFDGSMKWTGDAVIVEITDDDVQDVEIRLRTGAAVDGLVIAEGTSDPALLSKVSQMRVQLFARSTDVNTTPNFRSAQIGPGNTFHIEGLGPGTYSVMIAQPGPDPIFMLRSIEQEGVTSPNNNIQISPGVEHSTLKLVIETGGGTIRGQVNVTGGEIPAGWRLTGSVRRAGSTVGLMRSLIIDARGTFLVEHLAAGEYELSVSIYPAAPMSSTPRGPFPTTRKTVSLTGNGEAVVTITLDLAASPTSNQ